MAEDDEHRLRRGDYDRARFLALSDGVFAVAMTLLVFDLAVPASIPHTDAALQAALQKLQPNLYTFVLSFLIVGTYWGTHRRLLRDVVRINQALVWLNLAQLLVICAMPFTASILSKYGDLSTSVVIYAVNITLVGVISAVMRTVTWLAHLLQPRPSRHEYLASMIQWGGVTAVFIASIPIAVLVDPHIAEFFWLTGFALRFVFTRLGLRTPA